MAKTEQLQLRVSRDQKDRIKQQAAFAGEDVSKWILRKLLPTEADEFQRLVDQLKNNPDRESFAFSDIHDFLQSLSAKNLELASASIDLAGLSAFQSNYLAAMVEQRFSSAGVCPPDWIRSIPRLPNPWFASELISLRLHLLMTSPPPFRRRNIFIDSTLGDRV